MNNKNMQINQVFMSYKKIALLGTLFFIALIVITKSQVFNSEAAKLALEPLKDLMKLFTGTFVFFGGVCGALVCDGHWAKRILGFLCGITILALILMAINTLF